MPTAVDTIGHSTHPLEKFVALLTEHTVTAVADVRSRPYSRFNPQYDRASLQAALKDARIAYVFLGRELGARTDDPSCYVEGAVQYDRLARTELFQQGLARLEEGSRRHCIALMCAEKDPLTRHRAILVCRHLVQRDLEVRHILEDGSIESHDAALERLLAELGHGGRDLFRSRAEMIEDAYNERGAAIAFTAPEELA